jgi:hypothetical protein
MPRSDRPRLHDHVVWRAAADKPAPGALAANGEFLTSLVPKPVVTVVLFPKSTAVTRAIWRANSA